jgi:hypothetical protein
LSLEEYEQWFRDAGFEKTGEGTILTEEWCNQSGTCIYVNRGDQLTENERAAAIGRFRRYLGIDRPIGGGGVH